MAYKATASVAGHPPLSGNKSVMIKFVSDTEPDKYEFFYLDGNSAENLLHLLATAVSRVQGVPVWTSTGLKGSDQ